MKRARQLILLLTLFSALACQPLVNVGDSTTPQPLQLNGDLTLTPGRSLTLSASGGTPPYRYSLTNPGNLSLSAGGVLTRSWERGSGRVRVTDGAGTSVEADVNVAPGPMLYGTTGYAVNGTALTPGRGVQFSLATDGHEQGQYPRVAQFDARGALLWSTQAGASDNMGASSIQDANGTFLIDPVSSVDPGGGHYTIGPVLNFCTFGFFLARILPDGTRSWLNDLWPDGGFCSSLSVVGGILPDGNGDYYVVANGGRIDGLYWDSLASAGGAGVLKFGPDGTVRWKGEMHAYSDFSGTSAPTAYGKMLNGDGSLILAGYHLKSSCIPGYCAGGSLGGTEVGTGVTSLFLMSLSPAGSQNWIIQYWHDYPIASGNGNDFQYHQVLHDSANNIYLVGDINASYFTNQGVHGVTDTAIIKVSSAGAAVWAVQIGGGAGTSLIGNLTIDSSDHLILAGTTTGTVGTLHGTAGGAQGFVAGINGTDGSVAWGQTFGAGSGRRVDGNLYLATSGALYYYGYASNGSISGATQIGAHGHDDLLLARLDSSGTLAWMEQLGAGGASIVHPAANGLSEDAHGNLMLYGTSTGNLSTRTVAGTVGKGDAFLLQFNASGSLLWAAQVGSGPGTFTPAGLFSDGTDWYLLGAGNKLDWPRGSGSADGEETAFAVKIDASGNVQ